MCSARADAALIGSSHDTRIRRRLRQSGSRHARCFAPQPPHRRKNTRTQERPHPPAAQLVRRMRTTRSTTVLRSPRRQRPHQPPLHRGRTSHYSTQPLSTRRPRLCTGTSVRTTARMWGSPALLFGYPHTTRYSALNSLSTPLAFSPVRCAPLRSSPSRLTYRTRDPSHPPTTARAAWTQAASPDVSSQVSLKRRHYVRAAHVRCANAAHRAVMRSRYGLCSDRRCLRELGS
jgi:hypothetical protein